MNSPLNRATPYIALFFTWLAALAAFNLENAPWSNRTMLGSVLYWTFWCTLYIVGLAYGYRQHGAPPSRKANVINAVFIVIFGGIVPLLGRGSVNAMFYSMMGCQIGLAFITTQTRLLHAGLALSCVMMALTASLRNADIPLMLTLPVFLSFFVVGLVSGQLASVQASQADGGYISPKRSWLGVSGAVVVAATLLGFAILMVTPFPTSPSEWRLDRQYINAAQTAMGDAPGDVPKPTIPDESWPPAAAAQNTFRQEISRAQTVGQAASAVGKSGASFLRSVATHYPWWWLWVLGVIATLVLLQPAVQRWLRVHWDWLQIRFRPGHFNKPSASAELRQAWDRLLIHRGLPRLVSQTLTQHAASAPATATARALLEGFAKIAESQAYGPARDESHTLAQVYLHSFNLLARENSHARQV